MEIYTTLTQTNNGLAISPVSSQIQSYPSISPLGEGQLQLEPISFYTDLQTNNVVEKYYNPYFYCLTDDSTECTQLLLDPLVLSSVDINNPDTVQSSTDYPTGVIPLDRSNNSLIHQTIKNITTGESRTIISSQYSISNLTLQSVVINNVIVNEGCTFIILDNQQQNARPLSDIDNFYVGKYITVNGSSYLITDYYIDSEGQHVIKLNQVISIPSSMPLNENIFTSEYWTVEIDSAFTGDVPLYPASTISQTFINYSFESIINQQNNIIAYDIIRHTDDTIGIMYTLLNELRYVRSTDATGTSWIDSVIGSFSGSTNLISNESSGISLAIIDNKPAAAFTFTDVTLSSAPILGFIAATTVNGSSWGSLGFPGAGFVEAGTRIHLSPAGYDTDIPGLVWDNSATYERPIIVYEIIGTNVVTLARSSTFTGSGWTSDDYSTYLGTPLDISVGLDSTVLSDVAVTNDTIKSTFSLVNSKWDC
jgi:hypothetical protein